MEQKEIKRVEVVGQNDKYLITAIFLWKYTGRFSAYPTYLQGKNYVATHVMSFHLGGTSHLIIGRWK